MTRGDRKEKDRHTYYMNRRRERHAHKIHVHDNRREDGYKHACTRVTDESEIGIRPLYTQKRQERQIRDAHKHTGKWSDTYIQAKIIATFNTKGLSL